jgi:hypothetical protein
MSYASADLKKVDPVLFTEIAGVLFVGPVVPMFMYTELRQRMPSRWHRRPNILNAQRVVCAFAREQRYELLTPDSSSVSV